MKYTEDQAKILILDRYEQSRSYVKPYHDLFNEIYKIYRGYQQETDDVLSGEVPNYVIRYIYSQIETKLPRLIQSIVAYKPFFKTVGVGDEDKGQAKSNQQILEHQIYNEMNFLRFLITWWKQCLMYGTSFAITLWEKETKMIKQRFNLTDEELILGVEPVRKKETVVYDGHDVRALDIFDCFPAPFGTTFDGRMTERVPYFILRSEISAKTLRSMKEVKDSETGDYVFNRKNIEEVLRIEGGTGDINATRRERMEVMGITEPVYIDKHTSRYEMFTMFEEDSVISIIENFVVRNSDNPFFEQEIPIVMAQDTPIPHEIFAIGHAEPLIKTNFYMNDLINLELENLQRIINPGLIASIDSRVNLENLKENLSGVHPARGNAGAALAPIPMGSGALAGKFGRQELERLGDRIVGSDSLVGGQAARGDATLGEIERRLEQANIRFNLSTLFLMEASLKPLLKKMIKRNHQFLPDEKRVRVFNLQGQPEYPILKRDDWMGDMDIIVKMAPLQGHKGAWAARLTEFLKAVTRDHGENPELIKRIGEALELEEVDQLVTNYGRNALQLLVKAQVEGMLDDPKKIPLVLNAVLQTLAPPGSRNAEFVNKFAQAALEREGKKVGMEEGNEEPAQ